MASPIPGPQTPFVISVGNKNNPQYIVNPIWYNVLGAIPAINNPNSTALKWIRSDGTNWVASTSTLTDTIAQGDTLYGSASSVISSLAKSTTATRYLANTGTSNNPAWDQVNVANGITGTVPVANGGNGVTSIPAARAYLGSGTQNLPANSYTKITLDAEDFDVGSYFDSTTNKRYVPGVAGLYHVSWNVFLSVTVASTLYGSKIQKNGADEAYGSFAETPITAGFMSSGSTIVSMNGSTDYIELFGYNGHAASAATASNSRLGTFLAAVWVGPSS